MFIDDFIEGIRSYPKAWFFISQHRLWHFVLWTGLFSIILWLSGIYAAWWLADALNNYLFLWFGENLWQGGLLKQIGIVLLLIPIITLMLKFYKYFVLSLFSPLLSIIAEKVQEIDTQQKSPTGIRVFWNNFMRSLYMNLRSLVAELFLTAACFVIAFIPIINIFTPLLLLTVDSYFWGAAMLDYRHEFHGLNGKDSMAWTKKHKGLAIANGIVWNFLLLIPIIGALVGIVLSVTAAGLAANTLQKKAS
ncbi:CysZ protein [Flexibacter flexilis DSM 6793]|uniref:CysZ protein n=1 Tax=Flexibacter flexilis DSM 6793 TaxID=927664 RepID=A0A1I1HS76_9BACT|nr:EI24 domain-containing protein [Flexibacter flexilis]SFC26675.1 CysZ protein [Flexibacter flexilis DSM 6793]